MQSDGTYDKIYDKWQLSAERAPAAVIAQQ